VLQTQQIAIPAIDIRSIDIFTDRSGRSVFAAEIAASNPALDRARARWWA
jgi:hypothetical protein